jgi:aminoglycoside phosphotransferase family enzyme
MANADELKIGSYDTLTRADIPALKKKIDMNRKAMKQINSRPLANRKVVETNSQEFHQVYSLQRHRSCHGDLSHRQAKDMDGNPSLRHRPERTEGQC